MKRLSEEEQLRSLHEELKLPWATHDAAGLTLLDFVFAQAVEKHVERIRSLRTI
ncbi:MAG: hypothetical protein RLZZ242_389 [Bacteroidota bacterium]|jgi:pterin-4a-carbinolamine dehydratase